MNDKKQQPTLTKESFSFPVGYYNFHKNKDINFQLNRFYSFGYWTKADAEEAGKAIQKIKDWKPALTGLAERHLAANRPLAAANSYRAAEFYVLPGDPDKIRLYDQFIELFYDAVPAENFEKFSIPYQDGALPALRLPSANSQGTILMHGGFDSFMEELFLRQGILSIFQSQQKNVRKQVIFVTLLDFQKILWE